MKIIELLNKIANGKDVPKKIKYRDWLYEFEKDCNDYLCQYDSLLCRGNDDARQFLNDEVEIIEEEKKIPEKINWKEKESMAGNLTKNKQIEVIARRTEHLKKSINEIVDYLDYLKNKRDE